MNGSFISWSCMYYLLPKRLYSNLTIMKGTMDCPNPSISDNWWSVRSRILHVRDEQSRGHIYFFFCRRFQKFMTSAEETPKLTDKLWIPFGDSTVSMKRMEVPPHWDRAPPSTQEMGKAGHEHKWDHVLANFCGTDESMNFCVMNAGGLMQIKILILKKGMQQKKKKKTSAHRSWRIWLEFDRLKLSNCCDGSKQQRRIWCKLVAAVEWSWTRSTGKFCATQDAGPSFYRYLVLSLYYFLFAAWLHVLVAVDDLHGCFGFQWDLNLFNGMRKCEDPAMLYSIHSWLWQTCLLQDTAGAAQFEKGWFLCFTI